MSALSGHLSWSFHLITGDPTISSALLCSSPPPPPPPPPAMEIITRIQHDLAYSSDKVMNLQILHMEVASRSAYVHSCCPSLDAADSAAPAADDDDDLLLQKAFEFDALAAYLSSEVKELEKFVGFLKEDVVEVKNHLLKEEEEEEGDGGMMKDKMVQAEAAMGQLQQLLSDLSVGAAKFDGAIDVLGDPSRSSDINSTDLGDLSLEGKVLSPRKQRKVLQLLEKSIARELELEGQLTEAMFKGEDLKSRLKKTERESHFLEESVESLLARSLVAETTSDLLYATSKNMMGRLNSMEQVNLLKVRSLENGLRERDRKVGDLSGKVSQMEIKCVELNGRISEHTEKNTLLERQVKDLENQLEHSNAALEAVKENENMLNCTVSDMDALIRDLKGKIAKAEARADKAEARCDEVTETNAELNEEVGFLRSKVETLERSLEEMNSMKAVTAKDIGSKAKVIADLVTKLALERERLHLQIATLSKKNKIMAQKLKKRNGGSNRNSFESSNVESLVESAIPTKVTSVAEEVVTGVEAERGSVLADEESDTDLRLENVRDIKPALPWWKYLLLSVVVGLVSYIAYVVNQ